MNCHALVDIKSNYKGENPDDYACQRSPILSLSSLAPFSQQSPFCGLRSVLPSSSQARQGFLLSQPQGKAEPQKPAGKAGSQAASMQLIQQERGPGGFWPSLHGQRAQVISSPLSSLGHRGSDTAPAASVNGLKPSGALDH